ncbi:MAG: hypothetical protein Q9217_004541 [Psora testacea]
MSRHSTAAQRNLTLTEELEKLEQSITLTLQGKDPYISIKHLALTFWKQFFEASANVSLSGYEEPPAEDETATEDDATTATTPSATTYGLPPQAQDPTLTPQSNDQSYVDSLSPSPAQSTPRPINKQAKPPEQKQQTPTTAPYSSPYESLKHDLLPPSQLSPSESTLPSTPRTHYASPQHLGDQQSSPFAPPSTSAHTANRTAANDILLHRVLDKNWRLQATPHNTARLLPYRNGLSATEKTPKPSTAKKARFAADQGDDLDSSPAIAAPELHAEIFDSPARIRRIPGVSVLTPAKRWNEGGGRSEIIVKSVAQEKESLWDSDSEGDEAGGADMSPPKTLQFHVPQGRLVRTPAREASKRIVEDLLLTAGGDVTDDFEDSPSVVKRSELLEENTF